MCKPTGRGRREVWDYEKGSGRDNESQSALCEKQPPRRKISNDIGANVNFHHLQAGTPNVPSIIDRIPDAMSDPKALLIELPQVRIAILSPSSLRVYLLFRNKTDNGM